MSESMLDDARAEARALAEEDLGVCAWCGFSYPEAELFSARTASTADSDDYMCESCLRVKEEEEEERLAALEEAETDAITSDEISDKEGNENTESDRLEKGSGGPEEPPRENEPAPCDPQSPDDACSLRILSAESKSVNKAHNL